VPQKTGGTSAASDNLIFNGKTFVLTGSLSNMTRDKALMKSALVAVV